MLNRRDFISLTGATAASSMLTFANEGFAQSAISPKGFIPYGTCIDPSYFRLDPNFGSHIAKNTQMVVGEGCQSIHTMLKTPDKFDTSDADFIAQFAAKNGLLLGMHALLWEGLTPKWIANLTSPLEVERLITTYIERVTSRYRGKVYVYNLVNEPISGSPTHPLDMRQSVYQKVLGERHIEIAYKKARAVDSQAKLILNEYGMEFRTAESQIKRDAFQRLVFRLLDKGTPLTGIGIQAHLSGDSNIDKDAFQKMLLSFKKAGLEVMITELDVIDKMLPASHEVRDAVVAAKSYEFLQTVFEVSRPTYINTWGLSDKFTWLYMWNKRADGQRLRVLPFDEQFQPKLMHQVIKHFQHKA